MTEEIPRRRTTRARVAEALLSLHVQQGNELVLHVKGWSMGPAVAPSRDVVVRPLDRAPAVGNVVLLRDGSQYVLHRVVKISGREPLIITKGDNCRSADRPVTLTQIVGVVVGIKEQEKVWLPWYWRYPFSRGIALLSRMETRGWRPVTTFLRYFLHLNWRLHLKWSGSE